MNKEEKDELRNEYLLKISSFISNRRPKAILLDNKEAIFSFNPSDDIFDFKTGRDIECMKFDVNVFKNEVEACKFLASFGYCYDVENMRMFSFRNHVVAFDMTMTTGLRSYSQGSSCMNVLDTYSFDTTFLNYPIDFADALFSRDIEFAYTRAELFYRATGLNLTKRFLKSHNLPEDFFNE